MATNDEIMQLIDDIADEAIQKYHPEMITALKDAVTSLTRQLDLAQQSSAFAGIADDWNDPSMDVYDHPPTLPKVTQLEKTRVGAPVRWEGMVASGLHLEIGFRNRRLWCEVGNDSVFEATVDSANPLYMEDAEMFTLLASVLDFGEYAPSRPTTDARKDTP